VRAIRYITAPLDDATQRQIAGIAAGDAVGRNWRYVPPRLPFDRRWSFGVFLDSGDGEAGYLHAEGARIFPVQPLEGEEWEEYQFGAIIDFPFLPESGAYDHHCGQLLAAAIAGIEERFTPMTVFCLLPAAATRQASILAAVGFEPQNRTCVDTETLIRHGLEQRDGQAILFYRQANAGLDPLRQLTGDPEDLRIFSNAQTKIRLQPTLEFWGAIQLYTTYSAYPFIPQFVERLHAQFALPPPERLLVSPCGGGDFLRLWPHAAGHPSSAIALDIREDLLSVAKLRSAVPAVDLLNLALCELLHRVVMQDGVVTAEVQAELEWLCRTLGASRADPAILRFDDPSSLPLLARTFDEILQNRAIPDWFFPLKMMASAVPGVENAVRADSLARWLASRRTEIASVVAEMRELAVDETGRDVREKYRPTGLGSTTLFRPADLTNEATLPDGPFDLILCWEFIHVFHRREALGAFIDAMLARLAPGGTFILTNIREKSSGDVPPEQAWAREHLARRAVEFKTDALSFERSYAPFGRRLNAFYPVLAVRKHGSAAGEAT
jgi:SAM-dependent methyltransferase